MMTGSARTRPAHAASGTISRADGAGLASSHAQAAESGARSLNAESEASRVTGECGIASAIP
jgi:hypothetical protein